MLASRAHIITIRPQLTAPMRAAQVGKCGIQFSCGETLDDIHHFGWGIPRWTTHKQMHVVSLNGQRFHLPFPTRADLLDQLLQSPSHIARKHSSTIPRNPDKVIGQSIDRMCTTSCFHDSDYSTTRLCGPLRGPHIADFLSIERHFYARWRGPLRGPYVADRSLKCTAVPAFGGPAFLPAASGGVSSRRLS